MNSAVKNQIMTELERLLNQKANPLLDYTSNQETINAINLAEEVNSS
jgi:hypothetical protein